MVEQFDEVDFALAAYRTDGEWVVAELTHDHLEDVDVLASALRRFPGDAGTLGLVAIDEDFFVLVRVSGGTTRLLLSDVTAAEEWELAASVLEHLHLPDPEDDDEPEPAGEVGLLADLGVSAATMAELIDDEELYPDELLSEVARRLGFGELFDDVVGLTSA
ncbi:MULTISPECIES: tRNA adenosine deaminase-associated protein [Nocardioides]|uniref:tRNA adenosine deaminase-associated protein n=1 Tax=Nocardioides salarius TaxID=374513 RepID=A0ABS2M9X9_9ACTN|nr:tRNA adenosine deaminase-associated protein [Nocardioides salarius]MBM7507981.1 putative tRNA adenosine deaminase-associated protein [Nocardioides salarius]